MRIKDDCIDLAGDLELEADMVINLEAGFCIRGYGFHQNEQTFLLTEAGAKHIAQQDREVPVVAKGRTDLSAR